MSVEVEAEHGGDPTKALITELEDRKKEFTRDAAHLWFQESTDWLEDAAQTRSALGRQHGRTGREMHGLDQIRKTAQPPQWEESREAWVWTVPHEGAVFQEFGAMPHEIRARKAEVLAFEWPDAPRKVQEQFEHTEGDLVFFESIDHPGIPAIGFIRYGRQQAQKFLEQRGYDTEVFTEG